MLSKNSVCSLAIILALVCLSGTRVHSQEQAVDVKTKEQMKVIMTHLLDTMYVLPETGKLLASQLKSRFESGAYNDVATPTQLAEALNRDLRELSKDPHLRLSYRPATGVGETILTPQEWETRRSSMSPRAPSTPQPGNSPAGRMERSAGVASAPLEANYHFRETKFLSGNIGYLKLEGFAPGQDARDTAAKSMALLANSEGMIIDLRRCPGGSADMVNFLASYFFDKEPRVLMTRYFRPTGETIQSKTIADIPGKRMLETDLYLLVSGNTASACESFAYTLQQYGRAKVIGERTAGAGYNNVIIPLGHGYSFSVSVGRPVHPRSGKGWQIEGVQPDTTVTPDQALEKAHREALQKLISKTTDQNRKKELMSALQDVGRDADSHKTQTPQPPGKSQAEPPALNRTGPIADSNWTKELGTYLEQAAARDAFSGAVLIASSRHEMAGPEAGPGQALSEAEQEVRKLEREWLDAYERRDADAMNRILSDDFKLTRSNGSVQTKADILAEVKTAPDSSRPAMKFSTEDVQSRVEGETVILSGRFILRSERDGQSRTLMQAHYTDTYVKRNGRWQVGASQMARIPEQ